MRNQIKLSIALLSVLFLCVAGCVNGQTRPEQGGPQVAGSVELGDFLISEPIEMNGLVIYPILSRKEVVGDRFLTLDEGVHSGEVTIREGGGVASENNADISCRPEESQDRDTGEENLVLLQNAESTGGQIVQIEVSGIGGASVNELYITNNGEKPLYLMAGEVVIGGKQDRTIAQDMIIPPDGKPVALSVFCVEHERWSARSEASMVKMYTEMNGQDSGKGISDMKSGQFVSSKQALSTKCRKGLLKSQSQQVVWNEVGQENAKNKSAQEDASYLNNLADGDVKKQIEPILNGMEKRIAGIENICGIIAVVNGKITSVDVFESTTLFAKLWPKLLRAYALDIVNVQLDVKVITPGIDEIKEILAAAQGKVSDQKQVHDATVVTLENDRVISFDCYRNGESDTEVSWEKSFVHRNLYVNK